VDWKVYTGSDERRSVMSEVRISLCPQCDACPEVVIEGQSVTIGEAGNKVHLGAEEWNVLVRAVRAGELNEVRGERGEPRPAATP